MIRVREHGAPGRTVVLVHGGPGAPGYLRPVADALATTYHVLEPFQRPSGGRPLTVARHVADLESVIASRCGDARPALVGHSWGAMLVLCYASEHPGRVVSVTLVGCGTFDEAARARMQATIEERTDDRLRESLAELSSVDPDERLQRIGDLLLPIYSHDPTARRLELVASDARGHRESWDDMLRLQSEGIVPGAFSAIEEPVLMLHGTDDPHPGGLIRRSLEPHIPRLEYREWTGCGHYPWLERAARDRFFATLREWLDRFC